MKDAHRRLPATSTSTTRADATTSATMSSTTGIRAAEDEICNDDIDWAVVGVILDKARNSWCKNMIDREFDSSFLVSVGSQVSGRSKALKFVLSSRRIIGFTSWKDFLRTMLVFMPGGRRQRGRIDAYFARTSL